MQTGFTRESPWASSASAERDLFPTDPLPPGPLEPICCWNLCPNQITSKSPRPAVRSGAASGPAVGTAPPLFAGPVGGGTGRSPGRITRRLLVETVAPDRHLVFNPLSGAVDRLDDAGLARLRAGQGTAGLAWDPAEEQALRARGYLFDGPAQEERFLEASVGAAWDRMRDRQTPMYTVCPTLACNLACAYCFEGDSLTEKKQGVMTDAQVDRLFDAIGRLQQAEPDGGAGGAAPWIGLFGGEPLLPSTRHCVGQILARAAAGGFLVGAITNGVNVTRFEDLLREYADVLTVFQVTLDGPKAVHDRRRHRLGGQGTFDEIARGVDLLLALGIDVDLRVNVDAANLSCLPELVDFLDARGWTGRSGFRLALAPVTDHSPEGAGCGGKRTAVLSELEMARGVIALMEAHPRLGEVCHLGFLRHLDYLVSVLEPEKHRLGGGRPAGPRYWYCEASTDKQYVFTPEGLIYSCTEAVGKPAHAVGRFDPELELWRGPTRAWQGRTILSHPKCRECSISTLCGGGCNFAAREQAGAGDGLLQVAVRGRERTETTGREREETARSVEPFCNAAEETVRAYLRHVGGRLSGPAPAGTR